MKVHEYQAKELLEQAGVAVPRGVVVTAPVEAAKAYDVLGDGLIVVKAQVHAGGQGNRLPQAIASPGTRLLDTPGRGWLLPAARLSQ